MKEGVRKVREGSAYAAHIRVLYSADDAPRVSIGAGGGSRDPAQ